MSERRLESNCMAIKLCLDKSSDYLLGEKKVNINFRGEISVLSTLMAQKVGYRKQPIKQLKLDYS